MSAQLSRCVAVYSRHFVASRINAPAAVVAVVFTLDRFVTTQRTMGWTKSSLDRSLCPSRGTPCRQPAPSNAITTTGPAADALEIIANARSHHGVAYAQRRSVGV